MSTPILKTTNLSIGYPIKKTKNKVVQQQLNIELKSGRLISLLGVNGIGKSTLLRSISGNQEVISGSIELMEKDVFSYPKSTLAKIISLVLTDKIDIPELTVRELLQIGRTPYLNNYSRLTSDDLECIDKAIRLTNIQELVDMRLKRLSDGQLQRVLIARAIAQDTPIIILDEPTNHLDLNHKVALFKLLKKLVKEENKAILFSCHDIDLAISFSDEIIVLKSDMNIQGETDELIDQGIFDTFFEDDSITFCREQKRFILTAY